MTIYLIRGITGEYSDQMIWNVTAYGNEDDAKRACNTLNSYLKERKLHWDQIKSGEAEITVKLLPTPPTHPYDVAFRLDVTGTYYIIEPLSYIPARRPKRY